MSGRLRLHDPTDHRVAHTHVVLGLGPLELRYSDPRRFGHISLTDREREAEHPPLAVLGVDALSDELSPTMLHQHSRHGARSLKSFLLDQSVVAGLGNIYVCEVLWMAGLRPTTRCNRLTHPGAERLVAAIRNVLARALSLGGTSLRDFVAADGATGENVHYLRVYGREGELCQRRDCDGVVLRKVLCGRATFHCPHCQTG
jgi:formamidopyrimidine-DNA glycosylase